MEIKDGYIYAPDLEVRANTTDYDPLEGVVVGMKKDEPIELQKSVLKTCRHFITGNPQNALPDDVPRPATVRCGSGTASQPALRRAAVAKRNTRRCKKTGRIQIFLRLRMRKRDHDSVKHPGY